jgi:hypothetical protein
LLKENVYFNLLEVLECDKLKFDTFYSIMA